MKVVFETVFGDKVPTSYEGIKIISIDELVATKELLEYEHGVKIDGYILAEDGE